MDFWKIAGMVFLLCAIINLPYFVMELREDKRKKQAAQRASPDPFPAGAKRSVTPGVPFMKEFHFDNRLESDLEQINQALSRYELSNLEIVESSGYLATQTQTDLATGKQQIRTEGAFADGFSWHLEGDTLYISGLGRLVRCGGDWREWEREICHVVIEPGCTAIGKNVFRHHTQLETVRIPDTVRTIGREAFQSCYRLQEIILPDSVFGIGHGAFRYCNQLSRVRLPAKLTQISNDTFHSCPSLTELEIPPKVRAIGARAFLFSGLEHLVLPDSVGTIGEYAFWHCIGLRYIKLPEGLKSIPQECFLGCSKLESIVIPDTVETIGSFAFADCRGLTGLAIPEGVAEIGSHAFRQVPQITYHGPASSENNWGAKARN